MHADLHVVQCMQCMHDVHGVQCTACCNCTAAEIRSDRVASPTAPELASHMHLCSTMHGYPTPWCPPGIRQAKFLPTDRLRRTASPCIVPYKSVPQVHHACLCWHIHAAGTFTFALSCAGQCYPPRGSSDQISQLPVVAATLYLPSMSALAPATRHAPRRPPGACAWAALLTCAALLPLRLARADADSICDSVAEMFLDDFAATDADVSAAGCDSPGASAYLICGARGNAGTCASVSACADAGDTSISASCTSAILDQACCTEYLTQLSTGDILTLACLQTCPSSPGPASSAPTDRGTPPSTPGPTILSSAAITDAYCADIAVNALEALALEYDYASTSCSTADAGDLCDTVAIAGACSSNPSCADVEVGLSEDCTSAADDSGCCTAFFVKPCSFCDPEPGICYQVCMPSESSSSGGSPVASSGLSNELVYVGGNAGGGENGGDGRSSGGDDSDTTVLGSAAPESASVAVPLLGRVVWAVSGAAAVALGALL